MGDPMKGIEDDVKFDFDSAASLIRLCDHSASQIDGQAASRASYVTTAMTDFEGHYSELFTQNANVAKADSTEVAAALRTVSSDVRELVKEAHEENKRRADARAWKKKHDDRGTLDKVGDFLSGGDDCPIPEPTTPINKKPSAPPTKHRQPLSGAGGGGGTSSARPEDLRSFANGSATLNEVFAGRPGVLTSTQSTFQSGTDWGHLDASGVFTAFGQWLSQNANDVRWARTVATAFEAAGGSGAMTLPNSAIHAALQAAGVSATRQDIAITMPTAIGHPPTTGYANDPVNTATGNFVETESDLEFSEAASELWWRRSYNSVHDHDGPFGHGWSSWCESGLTFTDEAAAFTTPDGRQVSFPRLGQGWDRASGESLWLDRVGSAESGSLVVSDNAGGRWVHTNGGRLVEVSRGEGTAVRLEWEGDRLVGLAHERGRSIRVEWDVDRIVAVHASDGRTVSYAYDRSDRLIAAAGPLGTRHYAWTAPETGPGFVATVTDADGVVEVDNSYDEHGRVTHQRSPFGRTTRFAYLPDRITVVSDEDGERANTWIADDKGRLVGVIDAHDQRQSTAYDAYGNAVMVTERDGTVTVREYDDRGRMVREVVPDGADVTYDYDEADRLVAVEVVDGAGQGAGARTGIDYTGEQRNPSAITDPEGGVTRMEWANGLLQSLTDPAGAVVRFAYDAHGEVASMTDALERSACVERDAAGRVTAAVTPGGARTTYSYDDAGLLESRTDPDGATWRFEHTAAGRRHAVVDPLGGRTETEHDDAGEQSVQIDPLGRAVRSLYDDLGNLMALDLPDGLRWEFGHDALGRLTTVQDPDGGLTRKEYDVTGDLTASVDPTGVRRQVRVSAGEGGRRLELLEGRRSVRLDLDRLGRMVSETSEDGATQLVRYDLCGRPIETVDPSGGLTRLVRDAAGRVLTLIRPSGAEVGFGYDDAGQLETVTDETGGTVRLVRDDDGRVVETHLPSGDTATTRYDVCGRVVAERIPGVGTTTCAYDAAGRLVERRDPTSGRRRFRYDAAGQMVAATDGNGGTTQYSFDANGRCTTITRPDGSVVRREYDATDHLVAEIDPAGRRTTAEYDAAGRQVAQTDAAGSRTEWRFGADGLLASTWVDGAQRASVDRDPSGRRVRITERGALDGQIVVHELTYDAAGRLVSRTRDGAGPSWEYTDDGHRSSMTLPDGSRAGYARDAAGRLLGVSHPILGTVTVERDPDGRMVAASADGRTERWSWTDGFVTGHTVDGSCTRIDYDDEGRLVSVGDEHRVTAYAYDEACQLVAAATRTADGEDVVRWRYDAAGRLVEQLGSGATRRLDYDESGRLTRVSAGDDVVTYRYDECGRRTREEREDGSSRDFSWTDGWLSAITVTDRLGDARRTDLVVDVLGELARVGGDSGSSGEVFVDSADPWKPVLSVGAEQVLGAPGFTGVLGTDGGWTARGWREVRETTGDPWGAARPPARGVSLSPTGALLVEGTEWMGNRVYDPSTAAFLSVDPMDPLAGAGWAGNPYAFAGNDPVHATDPLGLHPVTDEELRAYNSNNGITGWAKQNWKGLALAAAGGLVMMIPGGQVIGMGLMSAGVDAVVQQTTTGHVNWKQVAVSGVMGMATAGSGVLVARMGVSGTQALVREGGLNVGIGAVGNGTSYLLGDGDKSVRGFLGATGSGAATGVLGTGAGKLADRVTDGVANPSTLRSMTSHAVGVAGDGVSGSTGDIVNQSISTGHVDVGHAVKVGGASSAGSAAIKGAQSQMPEPGVHTLPPGVHGPEPRPNLVNYHHGAGLLSAPVGAIANAAFGAS
ncbi:hypothetical protein GCM10011519_33370 [Marmoricola endophyticus]|uniref:Type IV secretion protein Rhs n=1 Tax=Marmoricola endophyticus TaxID=2040280 RepID=A0A917BU07_9ACTN|nr:DUF6531 domain-containing protein [Marmoricola endophyticus]GGF56773.1 hypothetical protein GCM10011519_33370 [Marmoricola endophyticus]